MSLYRITNRRSLHVLGDYPGATAADALAAMYTEAGADPADWPADELIALRVTPELALRDAVAAIGSQAEAARALGVPLTTLSSWLTRDVPSSWSMLARLLSAAPLEAAVLMAVLRDDPA